MAINKAPIMDNAIMIDKVFGNIQTALVENLKWLDVAFGRAQKITKMTAAGKRIVTPNVYCGNFLRDTNDYIEVSPDSHIGNFSFFLVEDPQTIAWSVAQQVKQKVPFSLIFWFDLRKVFHKYAYRNTEYLKAEILELLNGRTGWLLRNGSIEINKCYEQAQNIYRGFTLDEIDNQFLMHPFAGFRFDGVLSVKTPCILPDINI